MIMQSYTLVLWCQVKTRVFSSAFLVYMQSNCNSLRFGDDRLAIAHCLLLVDCRRLFGRRSAVVVAENDAFAHSDADERCRWLDAWDRDVAFVATRYRDAWVSLEIGDWGSGWVSGHVFAGKVVPHARPQRTC